MNADKSDRRDSAKQTWIGFVFSNWGEERELFQRDRPSVLLDWLTGGVPVRQILNVEMARLVGRRADAVFLLQDDSIFHLEFQTRNDKEMPYREGMYCLLLGRKYRRRIRQAVLYLGEPRMRMTNKLDLGETKIAYSLIDIRDIDAATLIDGGRPADLVLAMLARGGPERLAEIVKRAAGLPSGEREEVISEIAVLCGLRRLQEPLIMELKSMASLGNEIFLRLPQVQDIVRDARVQADRDVRIQVLRDQLKGKFRTLPAWADERLEAATTVQVQRWLKKILTAETLEGVLGRK
jgi:hypothetical protein